MINKNIWKKILLGGLALATLSTTLILSKAPMVYAEDNVTNEEAETDEYSIFTINGAGTLTKYSGNAKKVIIPDNVKKIGTLAFSGCNSVTSIIIPDSVTSLGTDVFSYCSNLTSIVISANMTCLEDRIFANCSNLTSIEIPESVTSIEENVFANCSSLINIEIPASVKYIDNSAFNGCSNLTIYSTSDSYAATFASSKNITFSTATLLSAGMITLPESVIYTYNGQEHQPEVTVKAKDSEVALVKGTDYEIEYKDNVNTGTAKVIVTGKNNYGGRIEKTFTIEQKAISEDMIALPATTSYMESGSQPTVTVKDGNKTLVIGDDYEIEYKDNIKVGTAKVIITGKGNYTGTAEKTFTITKQAQEIQYTDTYNIAYGAKAFTIDTSLSKGDGTLTYTSSDEKVAVVDNMGKVTIKGTGMAIITVEAAATENSEGKSVQIIVKVSPKKAALKSVKTAKGKKLTVKWKKDTKATGYQIQYSTNKKFKSGVKSVTIGKSKTITRKIKKLKAGKKYYVRVRAYKTVKINGKSTKLYGEWSKAKKSAKIRK